MAQWDPSSDAYYSLPSEDGNDGQFILTGLAIMGLKAILFPETQAERSETSQTQSRSSKWHRRDDAFYTHR